jgi:hypothetical protein
LNVTHPTLLQNILGKLFIQFSVYLMDLVVLVFARRCAPGSGYTIAALKDAVGNSIRCARHKLKLERSRIIAAAAVQQVQQVEPNEEIGIAELMY